MVKLGGIQRSLLPLREVCDSILCLSNGQPRGRSYFMWLEILGLNYGLLSDEEQQSVFDGYHQMLIATTFPTQTIVRVAPLDLESYFRFASAPAEGDKPYHKFARDHTAFLRSEIQEQMLLERRFYIILPAGDAQVERVPFARLQKQQVEEKEALTFQEARERLELRAEIVSAHLENMGLHTRPLPTREIVDLYDDYFGTQRHREHHLSEEILEETPHRLALEDVLAPSAIRIERDHVVLDEREYVSSLVFRGLPHKITPGWMQRLVQLDEVMDVTFTLFPREQAAGLSTVRRKQAAYESSLLYASSKSNNADPSMQVAARDLGPLVEKVAAGEEAIYDCAAHILVRAESKEELERRIRRISETIYAVSYHRPSRMFFEQERGLKAAIPGNLLKFDTMLLPSSGVATMLPFFSNLVYEPGPGAILQGVTPQREPVVFNRFSFPNYNQYVLAPSGSGKSYKIKLDTLRQHVMFSLAQERGELQGFQIIIIDPEREYARLCEALGGQWVRLSPGSGHHINPFDLPRRTQHESQDDEKEDVLANQIQQLHYLLDAMLAHHSPDNTGATLSVEEKSLLDIALYEAYRRVGISTNRDTHERRAPLLRDLFHVLESKDIGEDKTGLGLRLRRYVHGSLSGLFSGPTNIRLDSNLIVFDTKELESELRPIGLMMISNLVWNMAFGSQIPRILVIDELATLYKYQSGARFTDELFRRGRKHYLGVTGITQHPDLFKDSPVPGNCAVQILLKHESSMVDGVARMFHLSQKETKMLRTFRRGEGLMLVDGKRMHVRFPSTPAEHRLCTSDRAELAKWEEEERREREAQQLLQEAEDDTAHMAALNGRTREAANEGITTR